MSQHIPQKRAKHSLVRRLFPRDTTLIEGEIFEIGSRKTNRGGYMKKTMESIDVKRIVELLFLFYFFLHLHQHFANLSRPVGLHYGKDCARFFHLHVPEDTDG